MYGWLEIQIAAARARRAIKAKDPNAQEHIGTLRNMVAQGAQQRMKQLKSVKPAQVDQVVGELIGNATTSIWNWPRIPRNPHAKPQRTAEERMMLGFERNAAGTGRAAIRIVKPMVAASIYGGKYAWRHPRTTIVGAGLGAIAIGGRRFSNRGDQTNKVSKRFIPDSVRRNPALWTAGVTGFMGGTVGVGYGVKRLYFDPRKKKVYSASIIPQSPSVIPNTTLMGTEIGKRDIDNLIKADILILEQKLQREFRKYG